MTATDIAMPALGGGRVLVVEPGEDAAATLTGLLRLNGFNAHSARTGKAALAALAAHRPQVVVIDLELPDADGCDIIRRARASADRPAVVVVTGHTGLSHRRAAADAGAAAYLLKPADPAALVRLVSQLCDGSFPSAAGSPPLA